MDYKLTIIPSVSIHVPQSSGHSDFNQNKVATHPENMWKKSGCPIIYQGTNSVAELPNIFLGEEIMLHRYQFLEEITTLKMKQLFLNLLSSRYCRSWGPGEAKSSRSVCYSADPPQPQTKLKKAIQGDTKLNANNTAEMHLIVYLGQSNLERNDQSLWRPLRSKLITEEKHMQVSH